MCFAVPENRFADPSLRTTVLEGHNMAKRGFGAQKCFTPLGQAFGHTRATRAIMITLVFRLLIQVWINSFSFKFKFIDFKKTKFKFL